MLSITNKLNEKYVQKRRFQNSVKLNSHTEASSETATHTCMIPPKGTKYQTGEAGDLNHPYAVLLYQVKNIQKLNVK